MSDIFRSKNRSKRFSFFGSRSSARSLASRKRKFSTRFPRLYRAFKKVTSFAKKHRFFATMFLIFAASLLLSALCLLFPDLARDYSFGIGHFLRIVLATVTSVFPFSVGEVLFVALILYLPVWIYALVVALRRKYSLHHVRTKTRRLLQAPFAILLVVLCIFMFTFAPAYHQKPIGVTLGVDEVNIYDGDLYDTLDYFVNELNDCAAEIEFSDGKSVLPLSFPALSSEINSSFQIASECRNISTGTLVSICPASGVPAKQFTLSPLLTKFGLAGVFTFYTGEANVNSSLPDCSLPYYTAHELSHQRGIASENDANFVAFLVCQASTNSYVRYSGHLKTLQVIVGELSRALPASTEDEYLMGVKEKVNEILAGLDERVVADWNAEADFYAAKTDEALSNIADDLNDTYLKAQGQKAGSDSYYYLTALVVNFYTTYLH